MKTLALGIVAAVLALATVACGNVSGLSNAPRATFSQLGCLDVNGDHVLNAADAIDPSKVPDFNGDRKHNADDAAFLYGVNIPLDPQREADACKQGSQTGPEYLVAHGYFEPANVSCDSPDDKAVLLVGIGGGVVNLKKQDNAAGVRSMIDALQQKYDENGVQTIGVIAGPAIVGAVNVHNAMEEWITHAVQVYLERYPCMHVVLVGHSHGAITADVAGAHLEDRYGPRIIEVVDVDRVEALYVGDTQSWPQRVPVLNIYETNDPILKGAPRDAANVVNYDASHDTGPKNGDQGGPEEPVTHTTIDNSKSVRDRIVADVLNRYSGK